MIMKSFWIVCADFCLNFFVFIFKTLMEIKHPIRWIVCTNNVQQLVCTNNVQQLVCTNDNVQQLVCKNLWIWVKAGQLWLKSNSRSRPKTSHKLRSNSQTERPRRRQMIEENQRESAVYLQNFFFTHIKEMTIFSIHKECLSWHNF